MGPPDRRKWVGGRSWGKAKSKTYAPGSARRYARLVRANTKARDDYAYDQEVKRSKLRVNKTTSRFVKAANAQSKKAFLDARSIIGKIHSSHNSATRHKLKKKLRLSLKANGGLKTQASRRMYARALREYM